ncbi:hypothetical protein [Blastococcus sp. SYSU D00820]
MVLLLVWAVVALLTAIVVGRGIRLADARSAGTGARLTTADLPEHFLPTPRVPSR